MKAFLVVGPEASGNKYMTRLLCASGCAGKGDFQQPFDLGDTGDVEVHPPYPENIALLRSYPYGHAIEYWPDFPNLVGKLRGYGYHVTALVMVRDPSVVEQSQIAVGHAPNVEQAWDNILRAFRVIFRGVLDANVDFQLVPYSNLSRTTYVRWLFHRLALPLGDLEPFADADAKHIETLAKQPAPP